MYGEIEILENFGFVCDFVISKVEFGLLEAISALCRFYLGRLSKSLAQSVNARNAQGSKSCLSA
jgi:hypothetical protein